MKNRPGKLLNGSAKSVKSVAAMGLFVGFLGLGAAEAGPNLEACRDIVGSYLVSNADQPGGSIGSRSLMTFAPGGGFLFISSAQSGVPGVFDPFTDAAGTWTCVHKKRRERTLAAIALDFTLPGPEGAEQSIARLDFFEVTIDTKTGAIDGIGTLRFFPVNDDPLNAPPANQAPQFFFEGMRIVAGAASP